MLWLDQLYQSFDNWAKYLPQNPSRGIGANSFLSLATGVNIALGKLDSFTKSVSELQEKFKKIKDEKIKKDPDLAAFLAVSSAAPSSGGASPFGAFAEDDCEHEINEAEKKTCKVLESARRLAIYLAWFGGLLLMFDTSGGILASLLFYPAARVAYEKWTSTNLVTKKIEEIMSRFSRYREKLQKSSSEAKQEILDQLNSWNPQPPT